MASTREFTAMQLGMAKRAIESGRDAAELPNGYVNFDLALAILDGCRNAITMAGTDNPSTVIQKLELAMTSLALVRSGMAEASVKTARTHIEETIAALRPHEALE
jgi:hypothetical protein